MALSSIRLASRVWPFGFGKDLPGHLGPFPTKIGLLNSEGYEFQPGRWMRLNLPDLIPQTILLGRVWDPSLTNFLERSLNPADVFIDVGAHVEPGDSFGS